MIVLDASAAIDFLTNAGPAPAVRAALTEHQGEVAAPHLIDAEVLNGLRQMVHRGLISSERGAEAVADFGDLDVEKFSHHVLLDRVWQLSDNVSSYDGMYIALAEVLQAPLLTTDHKLAGIPGHYAEVQAIG